MGVGIVGKDERQEKSKTTTAARYNGGVPETMREVIARIRQKRPDVAATFRPAPLEEIVRLQDRTVVELPDDLIEFYETMGHGTGDIVLPTFHSGRVEIDLGRQLDCVPPRRGSPRPGRPASEADLFPLGQISRGCEDCGGVFLEGLGRGETRVVQRVDDEIQELAPSLPTYLWNAFRSLPVAKRR